MPRNSSIWDRVYAGLRKSIENGALAPGSRIPSQEELSREYDVPRHAVRRALEILKRERLVGSWQGRGAYVLGRRLVYKINSQTRFAASMRENGSEVRIVILSSKSRGHPSAEIASLLGISQRETAFVSEILHFVDDVPMAIGRHYFDPKRFPKMLDVLSESSWSPGAFKSFGLNSYSRSETVVKTRIPTASEALALDLAPAQPVFELLGRNIDSDGNPIEVTEAIVRGDRIQLLI